jgi:hypothetical protein
LDDDLVDGLEFCKRAYELFERIRSAPDGSTRLCLRASNTEKKLLEEILPICRYIQTYYRAGLYISVRWKNGNQSYDAELRQRGGDVDLGLYPVIAYLEITNVMHENEHWIWELLSSGRPAYAPEGVTKVRGKEAVSEPVVRRNTEHVANFVPIVLEQLGKKVALSYPDDTSLVIQCSLGRLYTREEWDLLAREVKRQVPPNKFREILMFDPICGYTSALSQASGNAAS